MAINNMLEWKPKVEKSHRSVRVVYFKGLSMLICFQVAYYASIDAQQTLSAIIDDKGIFSDELDVKQDVFHVLTLHGFNASGKTNVFKALSFMQDFVLHCSTNYQIGDSIPILQHYAGAPQPTRLNLVLMTQGIRYEYGFVVNNKQVLEEWLYAYPKHMKQNWFYRKYDEKNNCHDWETTSQFSKDIQALEDELLMKTTRPNELFLSHAVQLNDSRLQPIFEWFRSKLFIVFPNRLESVMLLKLFQKHRGKVVEIMRTIDPSINNLYLTEDHQIMITRSHFLFNLKEESLGFQKLFYLASSWFEAIDIGGVLVIDDLESNLHALMVRFLISRFSDISINPNHAQLIFSTANDWILYHELLENAGIYNVEKNRENLTELHLRPQRPRINNEETEDEDVLTEEFN